MKGLRNKLIGFGSLMAMIFMVSLAVHSTTLTQWATQDFIVQPPYHVVFGNAGSGSVYLSQSASNAVAMSGVFGKYNNVSLVGTGIPSFQGQYQSANFSAAISPAAAILATTAATTQGYDVSWQIYQTASGASGTCATAATATPTISWTDAAGNADSLAFTGVTLPATMGACTTINTGCGSGGVKIPSQAASAIKIAVAFSNGNCTTQPTATVNAQALAMSQ